MSAFTETVITEVPFNVTVNACGEIVVLAGMLRIFTHITQNGNRFQVKEQFKPVRVTGVGLTNGVVYHAVGLTEDIITSSVTDFPAEETFINNFRIIGQGPADNYQVHQTIHVTINANGEVTASVDNTSIKCNG